jgi:hypothetical protein
LFGFQFIISIKNNYFFTNILYHQPPKKTTSKRKEKGRGGNHAAPAFSATFSPLPSAFRPVAVSNPRTCACILRSRSTVKRGIAGLVTAGYIRKEGRLQGKQSEPDVESVLCVEVRLRRQSFVKKSASAAEGKRPILVNRG